MTLLYGNNFETTDNLGVVEIDGYEWVNFNQLVGVAVGNQMHLSNIGVSPLLIAESATQPLTDKHLTITTISKPYASISVMAGSDNIWVKLKRGSKHPTVIKLEV